uniref:ZP domain-containing protein n=1 Tax=Leptobrachium leishanense TaxID=445787 RepID=A0A8C5LKS1_9ANUR
MSVALHTALKPVMGTHAIIVPGANGEFTVTMMAWEDGAFTIPLTDNSVVTVEDTIYISIIVPDVVADSFSVNVIRIYASATPGSSAIQYDLLTDGCPAEGLSHGLMGVTQNGNSFEALFAMKVFKISGSELVYLSADVSICNGTCEKDCSVRSFAPKSGTTDIATVSMALFAEKTAQYSSSTFDRFSLPFTMGSLLLSLLFVKLV